MLIQLTKERRSYRDYISFEEHKKALNASPEEEIEILKAAQLKFNNPDINEVHAGQYERDTNTFYNEYYTKKEKFVEIDPGIYDLINTQNGPALLKTDITSFGKILPIYTELKDLFKQISFQKKNNILIYGKPGNGKTQSIVDLSIEFQDIIFIKVSDVRFLSYLKNINKDTKKVLIFEEFTETVNKADKRIILNFLDGIDSINNCVCIMSTNYPEELETNIIDRPSRVRHFIEYKNPNKKQINIITEHFQSEAEFFYDKGYSTDNIINIINTSKEFNLSLKDAEEQIKSKRKFLSETFKQSQTMGIGMGPSSSRPTYDDWDD